jgi:hypothetical protein
MSGGEMSGNSSSSYGGGVSVSSGTFNLSGGAVSGNSSYSGGGVRVFGGTFTMSGGAVSGNTATTYGGGVSVSDSSGTFTMCGGAVSGNTATTNGGGVSVSGGTFTMSGGEVRDNILSGANSYGREVCFSTGTLKMSGEPQPERVFLASNARFITISGPLSGGVIPIDLGVTSSASLTGYLNVPILKLDNAYLIPDLSGHKDYFSLGNAKRTDSPYTETAITGYTINDQGLFVAE